jgi:RNA polymerase-binding transcription factor DksA
MSQQIANEDSIRQWLLTKRKEVMTRLGQIHADIRREEDPLSADFSEQVVQRENDEVLEGIGTSSEAELRQVETALRRLSEGQYGICQRCGEPIDPKRLDVIPHATRCGRCA